MAKNLSLSQKRLNRVGAFIFSLLACFLPFQMEFYMPQLFGVTLTPVNVLGLFLLILLLFRIVVFLRIPKIPNISLWLLFLTIASISYAFGPRITGPLQGVWVILRLALLPMLFYVGAVVFLTKSDIYQFVKILACSSALAGLFAVIQTLSGGEFLGGYITNGRYLGLLQMLPPEVISGVEGNRVAKLYLVRTNFYRGHGTFYDHNGFGAYLAVTASLSWGLFRSAAHKQRWFWFLVFLAQVLGSIATFSRSSWAALLAGVSVAIGIEIFLLNRKRSKSWLIRFTLSLIVLLSVPGFIALRTEKIRQHFVSIFNPGEVPEFTWRQMIWNTAFQKIASQPLVGSGTQDVYTAVNRQGNLTSYGAHNLLIGIAFELGIIALIIFLFFVLKLFLSGWWCIRYAPLLSDRMVGLGLIVAGISFTVAGVGSSLVGIENMAILFWLLVGLSVSLKRNIKQEFKRVSGVQSENFDGRISTMATSN